MNSISCDIVLLPDEALAGKAVTASQILSRFDPLFTLEIGAFYPHMSLYMFQLRTDDISKVARELHTIARSQTVITGIASNYCLGTGYALGYIDSELEVTEELLNLQKNVIEAVDPIRDGMRQSDITRLSTAKGAALYNLQKYGYPAVGKLFRPHITLSRLKSHVPEVTSFLPPIGSFTGNFDRIGLCEMGENGTCVRMIDEFSLAEPT